MYYWKFIEETRMIFRIQFLSNATQPQRPILTIFSQKMHVRKYVSVLRTVFFHMDFTGVKQKTFDY